MAKATDDEGSLKRLGGGRWQTRDGRFTIEPQSGTWVVVDGEQTDDLGLPLIRGPFGSLGASKEAIADARVSGVPVKPLPRPAKAPSKPAASPTPSAASTPRTSAAPKPRPTLEPPPEPRWLSELSPGERRRARESIERLTAAGAPDAEGITRRDLSGDVPAIATFALTRRLQGLGPDAKADAIVELLADGRDEGLEVRWRIVDGEGRPIVLARSKKRR